MNTGNYSTINTRNPCSICVAALSLVLLFLSVESSDVSFSKRISGIMGREMGRKWGEVRRNKEECKVKRIKIGEGR